MHLVCSKTAKNVAKQLTFSTEYKVLCLRQILYNTLLSTTLHIFKHNALCYGYGLGNFSGS